MTLWYSVSPKGVVFNRSKKEEVINSTAFFCVYVTGLHRHLLTEFDDSYLFWEGEGTSEVVQFTFEENNIPL